MTDLKVRKNKFLQQLFNINPGVMYREIYAAGKKQDLNISSLDVADFKKTNGISKQKTVEEKKKEKDEKDAFLYSYFADVNPEATYRELKFVAAKKNIALDSLYISKFRKSWCPAEKRRPKEICDKLSTFIKSRLNLKSQTIISLIKAELSLDINDAELNYYKHKARKLLKTTEPSAVLPISSSVVYDENADINKNSKEQKSKFAFTLAYFKPSISVEEVNAIIVKEFGFILNAEYIKAAIAKAKEEIDSITLASHSNCLFNSYGIDLSKIHPLALKYVDDMESLFKIVKVLGPQIEALEKHCNEINKQLRDCSRDLNDLRTLPEILTSKLKVAVAKL